VYFTQAYGHEAGFHYWQTLFVGLLGDHALSLRLPAALLGVLATAISYKLVERLFGKSMALPATAFVATLFMPVFFSRQGLRAMALPVTAGLAAYFMWGWLFNEKREPRPAWRSVNLWLAAIFAGLSSYTYMASRALPIFFVLFFIYLLIDFRALLREKWRGILLFFGLYLLISLPLIRFLQTTPAADFRVSEVNLPLVALREGNIRPIWENGLAILSAFGFKGDPLARQNVLDEISGAGEPIFGPIAAFFFYMGLLISLWRWRRPQYGFMLIWAGCSAIPSLVTIDAPSTIRMIMLLPVLGLFPVLPLQLIWPTNLNIDIINQQPIPRTQVPIYQQVIHSLPQLSTAFPKLSTRKTINWGVTFLTIGILAIYDLRTGYQLLERWPATPEVEFVWQASLTDIAQDIDQTAEVDGFPVNQFTVVGWTPDTMDPPTIALSTRRDDLSIRHLGRVGEIETLVLPNEPVSQIYRPQALPFSTGIQSFLKAQKYRMTERSTYVAYQRDTALSTTLPAEPLATFEKEFGTQTLSLSLLSYESLPSSAASERTEFLTVWQVDALPDSLPNSDIRTFLHLVDQNGKPLVQHDGLDAPLEYWQAGDILVQHHQVPHSAEGAGFRLGLYVNLEPFDKFLSSDGKDFVELSP
ncbi:MAG: glycosyltransferase family 39 protein, partial [Chloroflexota bacterium]